MTTPTVEHFSEKLVAELRTSAWSLARPPQDCPHGWSRSLKDPMRVLGVFKTLRIRPGFVLRAYQYLGRTGNGNGFVWALPEGAAFPDPSDCPRLDGHILSPPKPPDALDDFMAAIDGDGSALSYLQASLASRELHEFGAMWHGVSWGDVKILGRDPWSGGEDPHTHLGRSLNDEWSWERAKPEDWRPSVEMDDASAVVRLYGFSGLGQNRIFQLVDRYTLGNYVCAWDQHDVAVGGGGYVH